MSFRRFLVGSVLPLAMVVATAGCADAPQAAQPAPGVSSGSFTPLTLDNCGEQITVTSPPKRLVTLNQGATEVALSLGLEKSMAGTAYLDDAVAPRLEQAHASIPVLAKEYPSLEVFLDAKPDFAYASYSSAFTDKAVGTRQELGSRDIGSYVSPFGCPKGTPKAASSFESAWNEITEIASIFGVDQRAREVIEEQQSTLEAIRKDTSGQGLKVLWYDSGDKTPFVGAGSGGPQLIIEAVGATNVFADLEGGWADGSWERVVEAAPDLIVLADASWDSAEKKQEYLRNDPVLKGLSAVQRGAFISIPFSETTPGVRLVDGAGRVSTQLKALQLK